MTFWPVYVTLQKKNLPKNSTKNMACKLAPGCSTSIEQ